MWRRRSGRIGRPLSLCAADIRPAREQFGRDSHDDLGRYPGIAFGPCWRTCSCCGGRPKRMHRPVSALRCPSSKDGNQRSSGGQGGFRLTQIEFAHHALFEAMLDDLEGMFLQPHVLRAKASRSSVVRSWR